MKRILSTLLIFVLLISAVPISLTASANTTDFAGGSGTASDPYLISAKTHLNNVRNYLYAHFKMIADIEFTDADFAKGGDFYNDGQGWSPIGTDWDSEFIGTFDGDGHTIKNLYVNISSSDLNVYAGLFGYCGGTIKNLGLVEGDVSASSTSSSSCAGGIAGLIYDGTIENCYNTGSVSATSSDDEAYAGGIAGANYGTIKNCYNIGDVSATSSASSSSAFAYAGGIAGHSNSEITDCYSTGGITASVKHTSAHVNATAYAGGIVGYNNGKISKCYNMRNVSSFSSAWSYTGGIVGYSYGDTIENCYNTGKISTTSSYARMGGIAGISAGNGSAIINCYNIGEVMSNSVYVHAGGIAGEIDYGIINDCYNNGNITVTYSSSFSSSEIYIGGITGSNYDFNYDRTAIINCYNVGAVMSNIPNAYLGGITGTICDYVIIKNCYYLDKISTGVGDGTDTAIKCTANEMKQQSTFVGFDFEKDWTMAGSDCYLYPELKDVEFVLGHIYDNDCDTACDCGYERIITHNYQDTYNAAGHFEECTICGNIGFGEPHTFDNDCDTTCACGYERKITHDYAAATCKTPKTCKVCGKTEGSALSHSYEKVVTKATTSKNGKISNKCKRCGYVASKSTTIYYAKTIKLSSTSYTYDGKTKKPSVSVKDAKGKTISSSNYTVTYESGRKNVGTYDVTIKFKGNYSGTKKLTFKINPPETKLSKLTAGKKSITVSISKKKSQISGYQIEYSTSKKFTSSKTKTLTSYKSTKYTLKSLSSKKTYYVRVRTYKTVGKTKYYSPWSSYKYTKTK